MPDQETLTQRICDLRHSEATALVASKLQFSSGGGSANGAQQLYTPGSTSDALELPQSFQVSVDIATASHTTVKKNRHQSEILSEQKTAACSHETPKLCLASKTQAQQIKELNKHAPCLRKKSPSAALATVSSSPKNAPEFTDRFIPLRMKETF